MQAQDISFLKNLLHSNLFHQFVSEAFLIFIVCEHLYTKARKPFRKSTSHVSETNYSNCFPKELKSTIGLAQPFALSYLGICPAQIIEKSQQHSQGMFSYCIPVSFRRMQ